MRDYLWVITGVVMTAAIGYARIRRSTLRLRVERGRISTFLEALRRYMASNGTDVVAYTDLLGLSALLQDDLGSEAIVSFKPPFSSVPIANYPALVNLVPALHHELNIATFKDSRSVAIYASSLQEILLRAAVKWDVRLKSDLLRLRNPIVLILSGIQTLLAIPLWLLAWSGSIPVRRADDLAAGLVVRILSAIVFVVGLLGSVITVTLGWSAFIAALQGGKGN